MSDQAPKLSRVRQQVAHYRVLEQLGAEGMDVVYKMATEKEIIIAIDANGSARSVGGRNEARGRNGRRAVDRPVVGDVPLGIRQEGAMLMSTDEQRRFDGPFAPALTGPPHYLLTRTGDKQPGSNLTNLTCITRWHAGVQRDTMSHLEALQGFRGCKRFAWGNERGAI